MPTASNTKQSALAFAGLLLFLLSWLADLATIIFHQATAGYIAKPLIVIGLLVYCAGEFSRVAHPLKKWMIAALVFSLGGDVLLMFESFDPSFFLFGLASFLLAHIFYCVLFLKILFAERIRFRFAVVLGIAIYYAILIGVLFPHLGNMKIPVIVYGIVISGMLVLALHLLYSKQKKAGGLIAGGAVLFVLSDSVLAFNKFYSSFEGAGVVIMFTYGLAQLLLARGFCHYILLSSSATRERVS